MGFEFPTAFLFLLVLPPLLWIYHRGELRAGEIIRAFRAGSPGKWHERSRLIFIVVFICSLVAIGARPYIESTETGTFLILADVTRSMNARYSCAEPTFLERSKSVILEIINEIPEAKFGIIAFDRLAFPVTQITHNRNYLEQAIEFGLHVGFTYDATATNIGNALSVIAGKKQRLPQYYGDVRHVILISDGHLEGDYQTRLRVPFIELQKAGISVVSMGIGNAGETPVPITTEGGQCRKDYYTDLQGKRIHVPLRDDILTFISAATEGAYFGESQTEELIQYLKNNGLEDIEEEAASTERLRRDVSWIFMTLATIALIGLMIQAVFPSGRGN